jgi:hypothetical protein
MEMTSNGEVIKAHVATNRNCNESRYTQSSCFYIIRHKKKKAGDKFIKHCLFMLYRPTRKSFVGTDNLNKLVKWFSEAEKIKLSCE